MTVAEHRSAGCDGKEQFTHSRAAEIAKRMARHGKRGVEPYKCNFCGNWHIGRSSSVK